MNVEIGRAGGRAKPEDDGATFNDGAFRSTLDELGKLASEAEAVVSERLVTSGLVLGSHQSSTPLHAHENACIADE